MSKATDPKSACAGLLGLCRRAGHMTVGFDAVAALMQAGKASAVLLAADVSPKTEKELRFFAGKLPTGAVRILPLPLSKDEMGHALGSRKPVGAAATDDDGFAASLAKHAVLHSEDEKEEPAI